MPPTVPQHPPAADLTAFALGKLTPVAADWIARHLEECPNCRRVAEGASDDGLVGLLRRGASAAATPPGHAADTGGYLAAPDPGPHDVPAALRDHPRYRVLRLLGRGGMGVVYQAEHKVMERLVAVKVISRALVDRPDALERFHREVRAAAKLDHPNIVKAYDAEQAGDLQLLAMEYVEGKSLADVIAAKGPLPVAQACHYVRQAALGLQHAFERGMVHRDLKPHNLMLTPKGVVKILDFGLAKLASESARPGGGLTQDNVVMGTPEYMAPEQALSSKTADVRADIYALGCTLYCLLTGRPPFAGDTPLALIVSHAQAAAPALGSLRPDAPPELAALVARCLAKNPADRPQTPKELAEALSPFSRAASKAAAPVTAAPPPLPARPPVGPKQRRWLIPAAVAAGLLLAMGVIAGVVLWVKVPGGVVKLDVEPADAKVEVVDGKITVSRPGDAEPWRIEMAGDKGRLKISKAGFVLQTRDVTLSERGTTLKVELKPEPAVPPAKPSPLDPPPAKEPPSDYAGLAKGRWVAVLPSVEEFDRLRTEKAFLRGEPKFVGGVLECDDSTMLFPPIQAKDAIVRAWVTKPGPKVNGNVALMLRRKSDSQVYAWFGGGGFFGIGRMDNHNWKDVQTCQLSEQYDGFFEFAFAAVGDRLILYANGSKILEARDEAPPDRPADVGVGSKRFTDGIGLFRDVEVQVLDKPAPPADDPGFVPLFDGKDLTGWRAFRDPHAAGAGPNETWLAKDGVIQCTGKPHGYLLTEREYENYVLRLQWRWPGVPGNSGVFLHVRGPDKLWPKGVEAQLLADHAGDIWLVDQFKLAVDPLRQDRKAPKRYLRSQNVEKPAGEWNQYEITCRGDTINLVINNQPVNEGVNAELTKGRILLQSEGAPIEFRNVEIKALGTAAAMLAPEKSEWAGTGVSKDQNGERPIGVAWTIIERRGQGFKALARGGSGFKAIVEGVIDTNGRIALEARETLAPEAKPRMAFEGTGEVGNRWMTVVNKGPNDGSTARIEFKRLPDGGKSFVFPGRWKCFHLPNGWTDYRTITEDSVIGGRGTRDGPWERDGGLIITHYPNGGCEWLIIDPDKPNELHGTNGSQSVTWIRQ